MKFSLCQFQQQWISLSPRTLRPLRNPIAADLKSKSESKSDPKEVALKGGGDQNDTDRFRAARGTMDDDYFDPFEYEGDPYEDWTLDAQQQRDVMMWRRKSKLQAGSKERLVKMLSEKDLQQQELNRNNRYMDPVESVMANHPGITREEVVEMATNLGF